MKKILYILAALLCLAPSLASAAVQLAEPNTSALSQGLVGYWPLDGATTNWTSNTTADLSGNGNTGTLTAMSTTSSPVAGKIGQAFKFNRNTSSATNFIQVADSASLKPGTNSFTVAFWLNPSINYPDGNNMNIIEKSIDSASPGWGIYRDTGGNLKVRLGYTTGSVDAAMGSFSTNFATSTWTHAVLVVNRSTNKAYWYKNGVAVGSQTDISAVTSMTNTQILDIGAGNQGLGADNLGGRLDDVRIYNRALSAQEVALLYATGASKIGGAALPSTSTFNFGLNAGLVGYWPFDGATINWTTNTTRDLSGNGNTGTLVSLATSTAAVPGRIGQALQFNDTSSYVSVPTSGSIPTGSTARTVCMWIYTNAASWVDNSNTVFEYGSGGTRTAFGIDMNANPNIEFYMWADDLIINSGLPNVGWAHICATYNGATTLSAYVNGVLKGTRTLAGVLATTATAVNIGRSTAVGGSYFNGKIDDVRLYNRALSAQEIGQLYSIGAANVAHSNTVSGTGLNSGLVGYWTFDGPSMNWRTNTVADQSGQGNTGTLVSLATSTSAVPGKIGQALKFNGSGQYITNPIAFTAGQAVTVAGWLYSSESTATYRNFFDSNSVKPMIWWNVSGQIEFDTSSSYTTSAVYRNVWVHVALVKPAGSSVATYYVNGSAVGTGQTYTVTAQTPTFFNRAGSQSWLGKADDVRIYNRALSATEVKQLYSQGR
jgi:hypothetical protein